MLDKLFVSQPRVKILNLFFSRPAAEFYARQIAKETKLDPGNTQRELEKLAGLGLLEIKKIGKSRFFKLNRKNPYLPGLKSLFAQYDREQVSASPPVKKATVSLKFLDDADPWLLGEDIPDMDLFFSQIWLSCFTNKFRQVAGVNYKKIMTIYKGYHLWFYFGAKDSFKVGEHIVNRFIKNPKYADKVNLQIVKWSDKLRNFSKKIPQDNLAKLSDSRLWDIYREHDRIHTVYYEWGWIPVAVDMFHNNLTEKVKQHLRELDVSEDKINEYLVILTRPAKKSLIQLEQDEFLKLAIRIQRDSRQCKIFKDLYKNFQEREAAPYGLKTHTPEYERMLEEKMDGLKDEIKADIYRLIETHYKKYFFIKHMWIGKDGVYSFDYYLKELVKLVNSGADLQTKLLAEEKEFERGQKQRRELIKKLKVRDPWLTIINAWGDFMVTKIYRRFAQIYAIYQMQAVLQEIARRCDLNLMQVRFMLKDEIRTALLANIIDRQNIKSRTRFCVLWNEAGKQVIFTGSQAKALAAPALKAEVKNIDEITGQTGCIGKARGTVKIVVRPADMVKFNKGDILVSIATDPDIVPAMKKAAAIVTDQGGVTSHAAIVSREMNIPCVIGTKIATKVLRDGDEVEVDANKGVVKKI